MERIGRRTGTCGQRRGKRRGCKTRGREGYCEIAVVLSLPRRVRLLMDRRGGVFGGVLAVTDVLGGVSDGGGEQKGGRGQKTREEPKRPRERDGGR